MFKKICILRRPNLGRTSALAIKRDSGHSMDVVLNRDYDLKEKYDLVIRWGCTTTVRAGRVLNHASAIGRVNNKWLFRKEMMSDDEMSGYVPRTLESLEEWELKKEQFPHVVVRPHFHSQGRDILLVHKDHEDLKDRLLYAECNIPNHYVTEIVNKKEEYRVYVVQGRAVCVAKKQPYNSSDFAWNVAQGGSFENVRWSDWPLKAVKIAIKATNFMALDFGGVDIIIDQNDKPFILEINSAPSLTSAYRQACFSKAFDYMIETENTGIIPLVDRLSNWKKFIHPALSDKALINEEVGN